LTELLRDALNVIEIGPPLVEESKTRRKKKKGNRNMVLFGTERIPCRYQQEQDRAKALEEAEKRNSEQEFKDLLRRLKQARLKEMANERKAVKRRRKGGVDALFRPAEKRQAIGEDEMGEGEGEGTSLKGDAEDNGDNDDGEGQGGTEKGVKNEKGKKKDKGKGKGRKKRDEEEEEMDIDLHDLSDEDLW
jgi:hypothetical protein